MYNKNSKIKSMIISKLRKLFEIFEFFQRGDPLISILLKIRFWIFQKFQKKI